MGNLTQYTLDIDNNIAVVNAYDATTENFTGSSVYLGGVSEPNKLFAYGITYYDDNNIHSRNVYMNGLDLQSQTVAMNTTEYFTYDKLNRLTYWGSTDVPYTDSNYAASKKINYDVLGQKLYNVNVNNSLIEDNNYDGEETDALSKSTYHPDVVKTEQSNQFPSQIITYNFYNKVSTITNTVGTTIRELSIGYRPNRSRYKTVYSENNTDLLTKYFNKGYEKAIDHSTNTEQKTYYLENGNGLAAVYIIETNQAPAFYYVMKDHLGSIWALIDENGDFVERYAYDPWGNRKNPDDWSIADNRTDFIIDRGYTSHEHNDLLGMINANGRYYDPLLGEFISPDPYVQSPTNPQNFNRYAYCLNNPLVYNDPSGDFITWSFNNGGFSIGLNFTPTSIPLGFGVIIGWADGASFGVYGEVGYRVGGTGFGSGVTVQQSLDYNFKHDNWGTTTTAGVYASYGLFNVGGNISSTYDIFNKTRSNSWGVSAGIGFGDDASGIGFNVGYGSGGWTYGIGGYYNSKAWESNPEYNPEVYYDCEIEANNNCYSYAIDDPFNNIEGKPQPGAYAGRPIDCDPPDLNEIISASVADGFIKKPNFFNKLGFGKRGYYSVYLVMDNTDGVQDYHWYRQDKGGFWSQKHGADYVSNVDGSGHLIRNPARANHFYGGPYYYRNGNFAGNLNYNGNGIFLWVKRR